MSKNKYNVPLVYGNYFEDSVEKMMNSKLYNTIIEEYQKCPWVNI